MGEYLTNDSTMRPFGEGDHRPAAEAIERFGREKGSTDASVLNSFACTTYETAQAALNLVEGGS